MSYLMPKLSSLKDSTIQPKGGRRRKFMFHKGISRKVNVIVVLEFELAHYDINV